MSLDGFFENKIRVFEPPLLRNAKKAPVKKSIKNKNKIELVSDNYFKFTSLSSFFFHGPPCLSLTQTKQ
jgi:hypothetical protein